MKRYLIIDGGTTNLRVTLADETAAVLAVEKRSVGAAAGAIAGSNAALRAALRECIDSLLSAAGLTSAQVDGCIAYGMITSASGLCEIPHLCAPAAAEDFRSGLVVRQFADVAEFPITFIPGLRNFSGPVDAGNVMQMDMMRGEETETVGFMRLAAPAADFVLILPGSHNKLIAAGADGTIYGCMTTISGELLSALTHHTILTEAVGGAFVLPERYDRELFLAGADACAAGISRAAFSARILHTLGGLPHEKVASFLLGVALSADIDALRAFDRVTPDTALYIAGKEPLQRALCDLLQHAGYAVQPVDASTAARIGVTGAMTIAGWI